MSTYVSNFISMTFNANPDQFSKTLVTTRIRHYFAYVNIIFYGKILRFILKKRINSFI